ncbi:hypothetical protein MNBD_PLANCTO02-1956 [hydrothermal vent metagenome]|uniref:DUF547 domain-containing protein n=1 Tax=hydrothermal vent metagenome TaxID=652676 RepID=A0A3B1D7P8_9ZZZZ
MKEREKIVATGLTIFMLILWVGFLFHHSAQFAGSLWGGVFALSGALLMLVPLLYMIIKRVKPLKSKVTTYVSMRTLLALHIYAGIVGPILVLLHTGHKFESPLGIALTGLTLVVVISGFVGRYLMGQFSKEIREKKTMLNQLKLIYQQTANKLATQPQQAETIRFFSGFYSRLTAGLFLREETIEENITVSPSLPHNPSGSEIIQLAESIADIEYAIETHEFFKQWFGKWLKFHIVISFVLYGLMILHIWGAVHFGLRWFTPWRSNTSHFARLETASNRNKSKLHFVSERSDEQTLNKVALFETHFNQLFKQYWHTPVFIHGIQTTVFDYAGIANEIDQPRSNLTLALQALEQVSPSRLGGGNREKAFWINVYNIEAMKMVAEKYPVTSITDSKISSGNPWGIQGIRVGEERYGLSQIENKILLKKFNDPRIVFAVSCAAISCPDRLQSIISADQLDSQLDEMIRNLLTNKTKGMIIDRQNKVVTLSWIFKADRRLFGDGSDTGILDFVLRYTSEENRNWMSAHRDTIQLKFFKHDWGLNDLALEDNKTEGNQQK